MEFPELLSNKITMQISESVPEYTETQLEQINYGLSCVISNIYKLVITLAVSYFLNIMDYMLITIFSFGFLRAFAAGVHAKKELSCFLSTNIILFSISYIGMNITLSYTAITILFLLSFVFIFRYAPSDTEERPIVSKRLRKKLKICSISALLVLFILAIFFSGTKTSSIISFAVITESILILPIAYKVAGSKYGVGINK